MKVIFYNHFHNGDIHVSREFVRDICNKYGSEHCYMHNNSPRLLLDQPKIKHIQGVPSVRDGVFFDGDQVFIHTWYDCMNKKYQRPGKWCHFSTLYGLFQDVYEALKIQIDKPAAYVPRIDYKQYSIDGIDRFIRNRNRRRVMISNNDVTSGQADNFDFTDAIVKASKSCPQCDFLVTNKCKINEPNVFFTPDIIGVAGNDLNENAYLSTKCDIIVGRGSGPYTFAFNVDNFLDTNKLFIGFAIYDSVIKWHDDAKCKIMYERDWRNAANVIINALKG